MASYLTGAERQVETAEQKSEIRKALTDLLNLSPAEARARRYADYQGNAGAWTSLQLLQKYYVPAKPASLNADRFYADASAPQARSILQRCLSELN